MAKANLQIIVDAKDNASGVLGRIGGALGSLGTLAAGAALAGVTALGAGLAWSVGQAMEAENELTELNAVIKSTGGIANVTSEEAQKLATSFQNITRFSDDAIIAGQSMLLTFTNIGSDVFPMAAEAMLNLAAKFGDMEQASVMLGKALNDPAEGVTALKRMGIQLSNAQNEQIAKFLAVNDIASAQRVILGELETQFGGLAVAAGATTAGKFDILRNKIGDVGEQIGGAFLPLLGLAAERLSSWVDSPGFKAGVESIVGGIGDIISVITPLSEGNAILALQNLQHTLMNFGVDPKAIQAITDLFTGNIFGTEKMTPGGMAQTGGLLRSMGMSDQDVATAESSIDTIVRKAGEISEAFGKIFAAGTGAGAEQGNALVQLLEGLAFAMGKIAAAGDVAAQIRAIVEATGGIGAGANAIIEGGTGVDLARAGEMRPVAGQFGGTNMDFARSGEMQSTPGQFGGAFDFGPFITAIANAITGAPPPVVNVSANLDGAQIANSVSVRLGGDAQGLNRIGGHVPLH